MKDYTPLDKGLTAINTPADAATYYLPFLVSDKMDLMAIKKELRQVHQFSKADISLTAEILVREHTHHAEKHPFKYTREFQFGSGIILIGAGIVFTLFLWKLGFIAALPFAGILGGIGLTFRALRN